jgi:hypothetical protein
MNWSTANAYCANKGTGWRLPTRYELECMCTNEQAFPAVSSCARIGAVRTTAEAAITSRTSVVVASGTATTTMRASTPLLSALSSRRF